MLSQGDGKTSPPPETQENSNECNQATGNTAKLERPVRKLNIFLNFLKNF